MTTPLKSLTSQSEDTKLRITLQSLLQLNFSEKNFQNVSKGVETIFSKIEEYATYIHRRNFKRKGLSHD